MLPFQTHDLPHVKVHGVEEAVGEAPQKEERRDERDSGPLAGGSEGWHLVPVLIVEVFEVGDGEEGGGRETHFVVMRGRGRCVVMRVLREGVVLC